MLTASLGSTLSRSSTYMMIFPYLFVSKVFISVTKDLSCSLNSFIEFESLLKISSTALTPAAPRVIEDPILKAPFIILLTPDLILSVLFLSVSASSKSLIISLMIFIKHSSGEHSKECSHELIQICLKSSIESSSLLNFSKSFHI